MTACSAALALSAGLAAATAQTPALHPATSRIVILAETPTAPGVAMLRDELQALGLTVLVERDTATSSPAELATVARRMQAFAALRMLPLQTAVEVCLNDRVTGKTVCRAVTVGQGSSDVSADVVVLRTVELLRVSLVELSLPGPSHAEVEPAPAVVELARGTDLRSPRRDVYAAAGILWSAGGSGGVSALTLGGRADLYQQLAVDLSASIPMAEARITGVGGTALVSPRLMAATLSWQLVALRRVRVDAGAGVGAVWVRTRGVPAPGWSGATDDYIEVAGLMRVGTSIELTHRISIVAVATVGATATRDVIRFGEQTVASWGRPFVLGGVGLTMGWN